MSVTFRLWLWWLWPYLTIGVALFPVFAWDYRRSVSPRPSWGRAFFPPGWWFRVPAAIVLWPLNVWEALR